MASLATILYSEIPHIESPPCEKDPDLFFPDTDQVDAYDAPIALCNKCDGKAKCLEFAMTNKVRYGAWGGTSPVDRGVWNYGTPKSDEDFSRYINRTKYYTVRELAEVLDRHSSSIVRLVSTGKFPKPDRVINHKAFWLRSALDIEELKRTLPKSQRK